MDYSANLNVKNIKEMDKNTDPEIQYLSDNNCNDDDTFNDREQETKSQILSFLEKKSNKNNIQHSDFVDSLQQLSIAVFPEMQLITKYFKEIEMTFSENHNEISFMYNNPIHMNTSSNHHRVELNMQCFHRIYPQNPQSCFCIHLKCQSLIDERIKRLKNKINKICTQQLQENRNCLIMVLIYLENRLSVLLNNKKYLVPFTDENDFPRSVTQPLSTKQPSDFFASLSSMNSDHDDDITNNNDSNNIGNAFLPQRLDFTEARLSQSENDDKNKTEKILPGSFRSFQDIVRSKTRAEKQKEREFAITDDKMVSPKICGAVWSRNGRLIFFNNILLNKRKITKNSNHRHTQFTKRKQINIKSFHDYNRWLQQCGASNVHSKDLLTVRKHEFATHLDEDEDRFADEFVVGFSLTQHGNNHDNSGSSLDERGHARSFYNGHSRMRYFSYKNAFVHKSFASSKHHHNHHHNHHQKYHHRHHRYRNNNNNNNNKKRSVLRMPLHAHQDSQHHVMPHLTLPSSSFSDNDNNKAKQQKNKPSKSENAQQDNIINDGNGKMDENKVQEPSKFDRNREGNAQLFCTGICIKKRTNTLSYEFAEKCKLRATKEFDLSFVCKFNAQLCIELGMTKLAHIFRTMSTFIKDANTTNVLFPSPYRSNYMTTFLTKTIDELYSSGHIQGIAVISCLLMQSQFFLIMFLQDENERGSKSDCNNRSYLLQSCVSHYLYLLQYRVDNISDIEELTNFSFLLNQQKVLLR